MGSIPRTHGGRRGLSKVVPQPPHVCCGNHPTHTYIHMPYTHTIIIINRDIGQRIKAYPVCKVEMTHSIKATSRNTRLDHTKPMFSSPLSKSFQTQPINPFPIWLVFSLRVLSAAPGSEPEFQLTPICHSDSNRTKTEHQRQQTRGLKGFPPPLLPRFCKTHFHHSETLEGTERNHWF